MEGREGAPKPTAHITRYILNDPALEGREVGGGEIIIIAKASSRLFFLFLFLFLFLLLFSCFPGDEAALTAPVVGVAVVGDDGASIGIVSAAVAAAIAAAAERRLLRRLLRCLLVSCSLSSCCSCCG